MATFISDEEMQKIESAEGSRKRFLSDDEMTQMEQGPGYLESGARGLAQGASLGFADEITGALESAFTDKTYAQARDESRANYKAAQGANPTTYGAAELGGNVATALVPMGGAATLGKAALMGAGLGAASGLGASEAQDLKGGALDALAGGAMGGAGGAAGYGVAKAAGALGPLLKNTIDDVATAPLGQQSPRGLVASALDRTHQVGASGNQMLDSALQSITPTTGNAASDQVVGGLIKGASRLGRYGVAGKAQGALDTLEYGPRLAQWGAGKASPLLEKMGPYANDLAQRSPHVFNAVARKFTPNEEEKPFDQNAILEKAQGTKYSQVLAGAAQRGGSALGATHFILQQTDPNYRQMTTADEEN